MTISSSTSRSVVAVFLAALLVPTPAFAAIKIVGALYDPPGADQGREWIKISNTGDTAVNIANYRLFESGTNHKLTAVVGTSSIAAGAEAIITTDPGQYVADNPAFVGTVFKSSFSLSNTSETIELKDAKLNVVDSYSYTAPPPAPKSVPVKISASKKTSTAAPKINTQTTTYVGADQSAAATLALQNDTAPSIWIYGLGLVTLLTLGASAALYARPATNTHAAEFELE